MLKEGTLPAQPRAHEGAGAGRFVHWRGPDQENGRHTTFVGIFTEQTTSVTDSVHS